MNNIAIILAAGGGTRINSPMPKQFTSIAGKPMLQYSLEAFNSHPKITDIVIVGHPDYIDLVKTIAKPSSKLLTVIAGGLMRSDSSLVALNFLAKYRYSDKANVLFHDAARPLVDHSIISRVIEALSSYDAATAAIKAVDTVVVADDEGLVIECMPKRSVTYGVQTPQGFNLSKIRSAYDLALADEILATVTDDCAVFKHAYPHQPIALVEGSINNQKVTYEKDIAYLDYFLGDKKSVY